MPIQLISKIARKGSNKEKIALDVINNPLLLSELFAGLNSDKPSIKYGCEKTIRIISQKEPNLLYPHFDLFVKMLDSENTILKWGAIMTLSHLAKVDSKNYFENIFEKYFSPIQGPVMITAATIIKSAPTIAAYKPHLIEPIVKEILKVQKAKYQTKECQNIVCGHAIESFHQFYLNIPNKGPIIRFITSQRHNSRAAVSKKAEKFIKKYKIEV